ncbi:MAG: DUF6457 domain-containing protein [Thermoleophilia bacterium]
MTDAEWIALYAGRIGVEAPSEDEVTALLELAGVAAHASQRTAAPIACWLAARAGRTPAEALELARGVAPSGA